MDKSNEQVIGEVTGKIQTILNKLESDPVRRKIEVYPDRLNFCCPHCRDSVSNRYKKRGNLYFNSMSYHCYNCGCHEGVNTLLKQFGESLDLDTKVAVKEIQTSSKKFEYRSSNNQSSMLYTLLDSIAIPKSVLYKKLNIVGATDNPDALTYLRSRHIKEETYRYFAYSPQKKSIYILNINRDERVIGYQERCIDKSSTRSRYISRSLSAIYNNLFNADINNVIERVLQNIELGDKYIDEEDGVENIAANVDKMSLLFNIMNVNYRIPLTIVEGPIDSLAIDNCVALCGATKLNDYFDGVESVRYWFDNDKTGEQHAIKKLSDGKSVFLWKKYLAEENIEKKVKDINDLQKINMLDYTKIDNCFSDDNLDVMYI